MPQPSDSAPPNASGALAMSQHVWQRTATGERRAQDPFRVHRVHRIYDFAAFCLPWSLPGFRLC